MKKTIAYTINLYDESLNFRILEFGLTSLKKCRELLKKALKNKKWTCARIMTDVETSKSKWYEEWFELRGTRLKSIQLKIKGKTIK